MGNFLEELKRRRVYRIAAVYTVVSWLVIQAADIILPTFNSPQWVNQAVILGFLAGLPITLILAWTFQITEAGVQKTQPTDQHELVSMRKRDYFFAFFVVALIGLLVVQQVSLFNRDAERTIVNGLPDSNTQLITDMQDLLDKDDPVGAYLLGFTSNAHLSDNRAVQQFWASFTENGSIVTDPENATIFLRDYRTPNGNWIELGASPLIDFSLPEAYFHLRFEKENYSASEQVVGNPYWYFANTRANQSPRVFELSPSDTPTDMVFVQQDVMAPAVNGFQLKQSALDDFFIDRNEVSNQQFKEFVDEGGYETEAYWQDLVFKNGEQEVSKQEALSRFVDTTGRPGPAGWELGNFPNGAADYPVTGISWYEAMAYARFRGKELPTAYHWARAAFSHGRWNAPMVEMANWKGQPSPVGASQSMGPYGALDMVGNAREWIWNDAQGNKAVLGGSWNDPDYMSVLPFNLPPMSRDSFTGFRLASYLSPIEVSDPLFQPIDAVSVDFNKETPVSSEVYEVLKNSYRYSSENLNPTIEWLREDNPNWTLEKVNLNADYNDERFAAYIMKPRGSKPSEVVIHFPGLDPFNRQSPSDAFNFEFYDFIPNSGRAFVFPVFWGSYERYAGLYELEPGTVEYAEFLRLLPLRWYSDLGRTLDYLQTRDDLISEKFHYLGWSYGASVATPLLALEPRLKTAVLVIGGFPYFRRPDSADPLNFVQHITQPTLMLNGRYDTLFPVQTQQLPFFNLLGTPDSDKRHVLYDTGHTSPPRAELVREVIGWLDKYSLRSE